MTLPLPEHAEYLRYAQANPGDVTCTACGVEVPMACAIAIPAGRGLLYLCEPCER